MTASLALTRVGGQILAKSIAAVSTVRPAAKPLHPRGRVVDGVVRREGGGRAAGVAWLDVPGVEPALVRMSRAVGLPARLPDIHGLALRFPNGDRPADLLLASTGLGRFSRFLLTPRWNSGRQVFTSLLPYRTDRGPLLLGAVRTADDTFDLLWASPGSEWVYFGQLELSSTLAEDVSISYDPVVNRVPGLDIYPWVQQLREPAYRTARRRSGRSFSHPRA